MKFLHYLSSKYLYKIFKRTSSSSLPPTSRSCPSLAFTSAWSDSSCTASLIVLDRTVVALGVVVDKVVVVVVVVVVVFAVVVVLGVVLVVVCRLLLCPPVGLLSTAAAALLEARSLWVKQVMVTKTLVLNLVIKSIAIA